MKVSEIIKIIETDNWIQIAQKGSHRQFKHFIKKGKVTINGKPSDDLSKFLENSILKQAGLKYIKSMEKYLIVIQKTNKNYGAYSPDVLGCVATGKTIEETLKNMQDALEFHLDAIAEDGEELPHAKGLAYYLAQSEPIAESNDFITNLEIRLPHLV